MSTLGDRIRDLWSDSLWGGLTLPAVESLARKADIQADLLDRERDSTQHAVRSNLDLIKRLKDANDKIEAVRVIVRSTDRATLALAKIEDLLNGEV